MVARSHVYMKFLLILNHPHAIKDDAQSVLRSLSTLMLIDIKMECESMLLVSTTYVSFEAFQIFFPNSIIAFYYCEVVSSRDYEKERSIKLRLLRIHGNPP